MTDESVFAAALAIPRPTDRAAYLEEACAGNPALRREVEALLSAHAADNPLDRPPADLAVTGDHDATDAGPPAAEVGDRIGPYRLMEQIGEGGFGLVFVAEQTNPVRRKVALKVLKPGMDTRDVIARFEAERQALALMDHPNIARVLDAGSTPAGRPYFVMELVRGVPITEFCDTQKLPPRGRLALFVQVCQAVQHAHQKGVIHRDIKPSNVLVTTIDGKPVPKVIDFGVAKAVGQSLTEKTVYTRFAQILGTPLYMSPEQAEMSGVDVDTRADVYALGVLLYELLTGTTPFDRDRFRKAAFDEIRRIIREEEPPRPSTRLSSLGPTLTDISAHRATDPGKLPGLVRGELDWIVMRCLEKDRNRRYETASGLARDVYCFLEGDSVEACPPTLGYRLRKLYRRNRAAVWVGALVLGLTYAGASGIYFAYQRAVQAEARLAKQRDAALVSEERALAATREAASERDKVAEANASLRTLADRQRRTLYASEMNLAQAAWESGDARRALGLLRHWVPKPGEEDLRGFEWHYWNRQAHQETRTVRLERWTTEGGIPRPVGGVSHDGKRVASGYSDRGGSTSTLKVWDATTGREVWKAAAIPGLLDACVFSDDDRRLLTWYNVRQADRVMAVARVWEARDGTLVYTSSPRPPFSQTSSSLSADGQRLIVDLREGNGQYPPMTGMQIIRVSNGKELSRIRVDLENEKNWFNSLACSPDEKRILLFEGPRTPGKRQLRLQDWESGRRVWTLDLDPDEFALEAHFDRGGERLAVRLRRFDRGEGVIVVDARDGRRLSAHPLPESPRVTRFGNQTITASGSRLAAIQNTRAIVFALDRTGEGEDAVMTIQHESDLTAISLMNDGSRLVTVDLLGVVREWDLTPQSRTKRLFLSDRPITQTDMSKDGSRALTFPDYVRKGSQGVPRIVDAVGREVGDRLAPLPPGHCHGTSASPDGMIQAVAWHPNQGECLAIVWDLATGRVRCRIPVGPGVWDEIALWPDGSRAALLGSPSETPGGSLVRQISRVNDPLIRQFARVIDLNSGNVVWSSEGEARSSRFASIAIDHEVRHLVFTRGSSETSDDWAVVWYNAATMRETGRLPLGTRTVDVGALSPDGRLIAIRERRLPWNRAGWDTVRVFPVPPILRGDSPAPLYQLSGSPYQFYHMAFSPDGSRLMATGDSMLRLWNATSGAELIALSIRKQGFSTAILPCRFSRDGHHIWAGVDAKDQPWGWDATPLENEAAAP